LAKVADAAAEASEPWWIIGSAAVALLGATVREIRDVDLMMSEADARHLVARIGISPATDRGYSQFRSAVFATWREPPLPVEVFGGFHLRSPEGWDSVTLRTRETVTVAGRTLFVPSRSELEGLLLSFGRPKDLERARSLRGI
jgi:hypothetical protein